MKRDNTYIFNRTLKVKTGKDRYLNGSVTDVMLDDDFPEPTITSMVIGDDGLATIKGRAVPGTKVLLYLLAFGDENYVATTPSLDATDYESTGFSVALPLDTIGLKVRCFKSNPEHDYGFSLPYLFDVVQNLLNDSGIEFPNYVKDDDTCQIDGLLTGAWGLDAAQNSYIELMDTDMVISPTTIFNSGTATVKSVTGNRIVFNYGTVANLRFVDMMEEAYQFPCCEGGGDANIIHNILSSCNAVFTNMVWAEITDYFALIYNDFEVLENFNGSKKIYIPKKLSGESNYLS